MKDWTIRTRVFASFAVVVLLLCAASGMAILDYSSVLEDTKTSLHVVEKDRFIGEREVDHLNWVKGLSLEILGASKFEGQVDPTKCALGKWLYNSEEQALIHDAEIKRLVAEMEPAHRALHGSAGKILAAARGGNAQAAVALFKAETLVALQHTSGHLHSIRQRYQAVTKENADGLVRAVVAGRVQQAVAGGIGLAAALLVGFLLIRYLNGALRSVVIGLSEGANQVSAAAHQIANASQSLAQGASEQAASLEETSASSEEISAMARKNSESSRSAAGLMTQSQQKFTQTNESLDQMVVAMGEINAQSGKISKIIKVIDEIAFQTNILALNAAVEAARAGEAGMGFAVVADEVRNLAQRSAQAAKDTSGLIEESIAKSNGGKVKVDEVATAIRQITGEIVRVKTLVDEVSGGSQQQTLGIEQVAQAIAQMEQVTQKTAADAEESAAAAEELNAQSAAMREVVDQLRNMVDGAHAYA